MHLMNHVNCEYCKMENIFPDDSKEVEPCGWCGKEIETGWSDEEEE